MRPWIGRPSGPNEGESTPINAGAPATVNDEGPTSEYQEPRVYTVSARFAFDIQPLIPWGRVTVYRPRVLCAECLAEPPVAFHVMGEWCRQEYVDAGRRRRDAEWRLQPLTDFVEVSP